MIEVFIFLYYIIIPNPWGQTNFSKDKIQHKIVQLQRILVIIIQNCRFAPHISSTLAIIYIWQCVYVFDFFIIIFCKWNSFHL